MVLIASCLGHLGAFTALHASQSSKYDPFVCAFVYCIKGNDDVWLLNQCEEKERTIRLFQSPIITCTHLLQLQSYSFSPTHTHMSPLATYSIDPSHFTSPALIIDRCLYLHMCVSISNCCSFCVCVCVRPYSFVHVIIILRIVPCNLQLVPCGALT